MHSCPCDTCKLYKKHTKNIEVLNRIESRLSKLNREIERQRDIFWNKFLSHRSVLIDFGYLENDYPTARGITTSQIRSENELFIAEIIFQIYLKILHRRSWQESFVQLLRKI